MFGDKPKNWWSEFVPVGMMPQGDAHAPLQLPATNFNNVRANLLTQPQFYDVALDVARTDAAQNVLDLAIQGDTFYIDADPAGGNIQVEFQDTGTDNSSPRMYCSPGILFNFPFTRVRIYNTAQAGKFCRIIYGSRLGLNPATPASAGGGGGGPSANVNVLTMPATTHVTVDSMPSVAVASMPASTTVAVASMPAVAVSSMPASTTVAVASMPAVAVSSMPASTTVAVASMPASTTVAVASMPASSNVVVTAQPAPAVLTFTQTIVAVAVTSTLLKAANANRKFLFVQNLGTGIVTLNMAGAAAVANQGVRMIATGAAVPPDPFVLKPGYCHGLLINAIASIAGNVLVIEGT